MLGDVIGKSNDSAIYNKLVLGTDRTMEVTEHRDRTMEVTEHRDRTMEVTENRNRTMEVTEHSILLRQRHVQLHHATE